MISVRSIKDKVTDRFEMSVYGSWGNSATNEFNEKPSKIQNF